jgi:diaminopimelate epimerase
MDAVPFWKMSGAGNDFILMDHREVPWEQWDLPETARRLCRRRISVGADGLIILVPPRNSDHAFAWRFFNSDGSEAEMCGNGARCAARFAFLQGLADGKMRFETLAGVIEAEVRDADVRIQMGDPSGLKNAVTVAANGQTYKPAYVNTGVPHLVLFVEEVDQQDVVGIGRSLRFHEVFAPAGTNVNFAQVVDTQTLKMRTYERGVEDETLACGTGAVASAIAAHARRHVEAPVTVITGSGRPLKISFRASPEGYRDVYMEGEARKIYAGVLSSEAMG